MTAQNGVIIPMPPQVVDPAVRENLGQKISQLVQSYNDMKAALRDTTPQATKVQFDQLLEKRRAAVEACLAAHKATLDEILGVGHTAKLAGLGADVNQIQSELDVQQGKMTALQTYFEAYKTAIAAGTQPPPLPAELQDGGFGISGTTLAIFAALAAAAYFWWSKENA